MPHSLTSVRLDDTIAVIQAILLNRYNPCATIPNPSFTLAWNILKAFSVLASLGVSYLLACSLAFTATKLHKGKK
jgi:hypothetical protein